MKLWRPGACLWLLCLTSTGCVRKQVRVVVLTVPRSPVDLIAVDEPDLPELQATIEPELPDPLASGVDRELRHWRKRSPQPRAVAPNPPVTTPAPVVVASAAPEPDPAVVIGSLSAGGDTAQSRQQAAETIQGTDRRLAKLSSGLRRSKRTQVAQVQDFQAKAREAVRLGDAEGAATLATKAALLLDDLLK